MCLLTAHFPSETPHNILFYFIFFPWTNISLIDGQYFLRTNKIICLFSTSSYPESACNNSHKGILIC